MKGIVEFFRPELKKFILPTILLLVFLFLLNEFYQFGNEGDRYFCDFKSYINALELERDSEFCNVGNMFMKNDGSVEIEEQTQKKFDQAVEGIRNITNSWNGTPKDLATRMMVGIDPVFPVPCEFQYTPFCEFYISNASYGCMGLPPWIPWRNQSVMKLVPG